MDVTEIPFLRALEAEGVDVRDGQQVMLDAREIKNRDEILLLSQAASMVDGVYHDIYEALKPGVRENDIVALATKRLFEMGSDQVEAINSIAGERCSPHPHVFSDRLIRPGDQSNTLCSTPLRPVHLDPALIRAEIESAVAAALPDVGFVIRDRQDNTVYRLMYQNIDMNQQIYNMMIVLFMAGAIFGASNLSSRIVEAQRRQIGIGMALGMSRRALAVRPLLVGAQIAVLGAVFGLIMGLAVGRLAQVWMEGLIPMPVTGHLFQPHLFLEAAALGLVLPFIATLYPVWRAVRVPPIDAIKTGHLISTYGGLAPLVRRIPIPGRSFAQMPVRNLLRAPRRTVLTILGIATAITTLIGLAGILDSAQLSLARIRREAYQNHPDRLTVYLNNVYPVDLGSGHHHHGFPAGGNGRTGPARSRPGHARQHRF